MARVLLLTACLVAFCGMQVKADTRNGLANALAATQIGDCVTTAALLRAPNTVELDPIARPVAHSLPLCLAAAGGINLLLRNPHGPKTWVLRAAILIESVLIVNNEGVLIRARIGR
jgi:hypothetical protein